MLIDPHLCSIRNRQLSVFFIGSSMTFLACRTENLCFRTAEHADADAVLRLMNRAYRAHHPNSWSSEAHLVQGARLNAMQYQTMLATPNLRLMVLTAHNSSNLIGCIGITFTDEAAEIGSFAVDQALQNQGLGKYILELAEQFARQQQPDLKHIDMYVLDVRHELIAFYERRGYARLNVFLDYPVNDDVGKPLQAIRLQLMRKAFVEPRG